MRSDWNVLLIVKLPADNVYCLLTCEANCAYQCAESEIETLCLSFKVVKVGKKKLTRFALAFIDCDINLAQFHHLLYFPFLVLFVK